MKKSSLEIWKIQKKALYLYCKKDKGSDRNLLIVFR